LWVTARSDVGHILI